MAWLDAEFPNLTAAAVRFTESTFAVDLMPLVKRLAQKRGHWAELESISRAALSVARQRGERRAEAAALATIASVDWRAGRDELAFRGANSALELWREIGDRDFEALARHNVGWLRWQTGDLKSALTDMREAARMLKDSEQFKPAMVWHNLNEVLLQLGRHREAAAGFRRTLAVRRADGDRFGESITLLGLARAYIMLGDYAAAIAPLDEAVEACRQVGNREDEWHAMLCRSEVRLRRGEVALAVEDAHLTRDLLRDVGHRYSQAATARQLARVYEAAGRHADAAEQTRQAATLFASVTRRVPDVEAIFNAGGGERWSAATHQVL
jgi:tetratricopeptide (TPR) repeat protein